MILVTLVQVFVPLTGLYIVRGLLGMVVAFGYMLGPIMVDQCVPSKYKSVIGTMFSLSLAFGLIISTSVSSDVAEKYWYLFLNICGIYELIRFIILCFIVRYESPYYILYKIDSTLEKEYRKQNKIEKTETGKKGEVTNHIQDTPDSEKQNGVSETKEIKDVPYLESLRSQFVNDVRVNKLVKDFYHEEDQENTKEFLFMNIYQYTQEKKNVGNIFKIACSKKFRKPFLVAVMLNFSNQFTGINIVLLYAKNIYVQMGFSNPDLLVFMACKSNQPSSSWPPRSSCPSSPVGSDAKPSSVWG
jgi:MFS family permease